MKKITPMLKNQIKRSHCKVASPKGVIESFQANARPWASSKEELHR
jgi:hypothetical protein